MVALPTLRPSGDGTFSLIEASDGNTVDNYLLIDEDPSSVDTADWVANDQSESNAHHYFQLDDVPGDFASMDTLSVDVHISSMAFSDDTATLHAQVFDGEGGTALTDQVLIGDNTASGVQTATFTLQGTFGLGAWNNAVIRFDWTYTKSGGPDNGQLKINAFELNGTYTQATEQFGVLSMDATSSQTTVGTREQTGVAVLDATSGQTTAGIRAGVSDAVLSATSGLTAVPDAVITPGAATLSADSTFTGAGAVVEERIIYTKSTAFEFEGIPLEEYKAYVQARDIDGNLSPASNIELATVPQADDTNNFVSELTASKITGGTINANDIFVNSRLAVANPGVIESTDFNSLGGFRLTADSFELTTPSGSGKVATIQLGDSGFGANSIGEIWAGGTAYNNAGTSWQVGSDGSMRIGGDGGFYITAAGDAWSGAALSTNAPWYIDASGSAKFDDIQITAASVTGAQEVVNVANMFILTYDSVGGHKVNLAGDFFVDAGGDINVGGGSITLASDGAGGGGNFTMNDGVMTLNGGELQLAGAPINQAAGSYTIAGGDITVNGGVIKSNNWNGTSTGVEITSTGITVYDGLISAGALEIHNSPNLVDAGYADFEYAESWYLTNAIGNSASYTTSITWSRYREQSLEITTSAVTGSVDFTNDNTTPNYNIPLEPSTDYILSAYIYNPDSVDHQFRMSIWQDDTTNGPEEIQGAYVNVPAGTVVRYSDVLSTHITTGNGYISIMSEDATTFNIDGVQLEEKIGNSDSPSFFKVGGLTTIDGGDIETGTIKSSQTINGEPVWSINLAGQSQFIGTTIKSSDSGSRIELDTSGIRLYDTDGTTVNVNLDTATGNGTFTGTIFATGGEITGPLDVYGQLTLVGTSAAFRSGTGGRRITIEDDDTMRIYDSTTNYFEISSVTISGDGDVLRIKHSGSTPTYSFSKTGPFRAPGVVSTGDITGNDFTVNGGIITFTTTFANIDRTSAYSNQHIRFRESSGTGSYVDWILGDTGIHFYGTGYNNDTAVVHVDGQMTVDTTFTAGGSSTIGGILTIGGTLIFNDAGTSNRDHIRSDDGANAYHFVHDGSLSTTGNSRLYCGNINVSGGVSAGSVTVGGTGWNSITYGSSISRANAAVQFKRGEISSTHDELNLLGDSIQIEGPTWMSNRSLYLRAYGDTNHGIWFDSGINGPRLQGYAAVDLWAANTDVRETIGPNNRVRVTNAGNSFYRQHLADHVDQSDRRWKSNVRAVPDALSSIKGWEVAQFEYEGDDRPRAGLMADTMPEDTVVEFTLNSPETGEKITSHGIRLTAAIGYLTKAVQELADRVEKLEKEGK